MNSGRVKFEVQVSKANKWHISDVLPTEEAARRKADDLLALKDTEGVRIIKESHFGSDNRRERRKTSRLRPSTKRLYVNRSRTTTKPKPERRWRAFFRNTSKKWR
jgi:hypothetical protein